jgi:hypothetical protein
VSRQFEPDPPHTWLAIRQVRGLRRSSSCYSEFNGFGATLSTAVAPKPDSKLLSKDTK